MTPAHLSTLTLTCLLPLAACGASDGFTLKLDRSTDIPTVFTTTWQTDVVSPSAAWVSWGRDGTEEGRAAVDPSSGGSFKTVLVGMKPASDYDVWVTVQDDQGWETVSDPKTASTGQVPSSFPNISLDQADGESFNGYLLTSLVGNPTAPILLDEDGDVVWWYEAEDVEAIGRAALAPDGSGVLYMPLNVIGEKSNPLVQVSWDGSDVLETGLPWAHHDFLTLPDGTLAYLAEDYRTVNGTQYTGDRLVELSPTGETTEIFNVWDTEHNFPFNANDALLNGAWPHANAIDYLEDEDAYLISFLCFDAIFRVDRKSRSVDWALGTGNGDFRLPNGSTDILEHSHQMDMLDDDRLLVFINGQQQGGTSRVVEYSLDMETMEAESVWEYWSDPALSCVTQGDVTRMPSGNTLVTFSYSGVIHEVTPEGEPIWAVSASTGGAFGYTTWVETLPL